MQSSMLISRFIFQLWPLSYARYSLADMVCSCFLGFGFTTDRPYSMHSLSDASRSFIRLSLLLWYFLPLSQLTELMTK